MILLPNCSLSCIPRGEYILQMLDFAANSYAGELNAMEST